MIVLLPPPHSASTEHGTTTTSTTSRKTKRRTVLLAMVTAVVFWHLDKTTSMVRTQSYFSPEKSLVAIRNTTTTRNSTAIVTAAHTKNEHSRLRQQRNTRNNSSDTPISLSIPMNKSREQETALTQQLRVYVNQSNNAGIAAITTALARQEGIMPLPDIDWNAAGPKWCRNHTQLCNCGLQKCFYPSLTNSSVGYVVGRGMDSFKKQLPIFTFEQKLAQIAGTVPLQLNASQVIQQNVSSTFAEALLLYGTPSTEPLWYFPTVKVPTPNLLIHIARAPNQEIVEFARHVANKELFKRNFENEIERVEMILNHPETFLLRNDCQFMVDTAGLVYHVDLDRIYAPTSGYYMFADVDQVISALERVLYWLTLDNHDANFTGLAEETFFTWTPPCRPRCQGRVKKQLVERLAAKITSA